MKHLCCTDNLPSFLPLLLHDLLLLCSFLISNPLILAYLLLLFPYLLKLLFLLYPLLFSTFLLLLALQTVTFHLHDSSSTSPEFPSTTTSAVLNFLRAELVADEGKVCLTEQLCAMVFVDSQLCNSQNCNLWEEDLAEKLGEKREKKKKKNYSEHKRPKTETNLGSRKEHDRRPSEILQRDGSMRKEKEWKRTLACKLFEERMTFKLCEERKVVDGAEEMDLLWEAYEIDADKTEKQRRKEKVEEEEDEDYAEKGMSGKLCCLQALKLSAGKMNLGVGRPSLVKVSMALKGMSVFNRAGRKEKICHLR